MSDSDSDSNSSINILFCRYVKEKSDWKQLTSFLTYPFTDDPSFIDIDFPFPSKFSCYRIHGHSHGLICLSLSYDTFLWNPTNNEVHKLPPSIFPIIELDDDDCSKIDSSPGIVGFGYDPESDDFKVVRFMKYFHPAHYMPDRVELYSLRTDQWREILLTSVVDCCTFSSDSFEMYHDGFYYWRDDIWGREYIQSFNLSKEEFYPISVPDCFADSRDKRYRSLGVWNGSVVMFHYPTIGDQKTLDIWEMKRDESLSDRVLWSKLLTIDLVSVINRPLFFVNSDELLMDAEGELFISYNVNTKEFKHLPVKGLEHSPRCLVVEKILLSFKERIGRNLGAAS